MSESLKESNYKPIPVLVAQNAAELFEKDMVVILAYDSIYHLTHTTTYGKTPEQKEIAADAGERCAVALGCAIEAKRDYEDYRHRTAGEAAVLREALTTIHSLAQSEDEDILLHVVDNIEQIAFRALNQNPEPRKESPSCLYSPETPTNPSSSEAESP
jgi:hypothetical protein